MFWWLLVKKTAATPLRQRAVPTLPIRSSVLRPSLSIRLMPSRVATKFMAPISTVWSEPESWLKPAAAKFKQAAVALKKAVKQLKALPQPSADTAKLKSWFTYAEQEVKLFETGSRKLSSGDKNAASKIGVELVNVANKANAQVIPFEFKYCRLEPSRFI